MAEETTRPRRRGRRVKEKKEELELKPVVRVVRPTKGKGGGVEVGVGVGTRTRTTTRSTGTPATRTPRRTMALENPTPLAATIARGTEVVGIDQGPEVLVLCEQGALGFLPTSEAARLRALRSDYEDAQIVGAVADAAASGAPAVRVAVAGFPAGSDAEQRQPVRERGTAAESPA